MAHLYIVRVHAEKTERQIRYHVGQQQIGLGPRLNRVLDGAPAPMRRLVPDDLLVVMVVVVVVVRHGLSQDDRSASVLGREALEECPDHDDAEPKRSLHYRYHERSNAPAPSEWVIPAAQAKTESTLIEGVKWRDHFQFLWTD
uniref:Uncharacterized protein n=1 Tax=Anopheles atroparvus TaxID=41427 RepID=A0A182IXX7_ANOAO